MRWILAWGLAALAGVSVAQGQERPETPAPAGDLPPEMASDRSVTLEEIRRNSREVFYGFAEPDGPPLTRQEFVALDFGGRLGTPEEARDLLDRAFDAMDSDGDGSLTYREWHEQVESDFSFADANDDGRVTLRELGNARENMGLIDAIDLVF